MADPLATVADYEADFGPISDGEAVGVERALAKASAWLRLQIDAESPYAGDYAEALNTVVVSLARRYLDARSGNAGPTMGGAPLTQFTQTAGGYSVSGSTLNPGNALWLTAQERELLGIGACSVAAVQTGVTGDGA